MLPGLIIAAALTTADLPLQSSGDQTSQLARQLLPDMQAHRTSRYLVLSDSDRQTIRTVEYTLADARRQYDRWCNAVRVPLSLPDDRLVCIVFHDRSRFAEFARDTEGIDGATAEHIGGFFSPRFDWVVFFHPGDSADLQAALDRINEAQRTIDDARERGVSSEAIDQAQANLLDAKDEIAFEEHARRTSVTIHEAVHQLVHVGVAFPGHARWPDWLHEGVAVAFETDDRRRPFGPDRTYAARRMPFEAALEDGSLIELSQLIASGTIDHAQMDQTGVLYVQAGALVSWLHRHRRSDLTAFLQAVGVPSADGSVPDVTAVFTETIGEPGDIEKQWLRSERR